MPAAPACTLMAEQEEGPYYIDGSTLRQDLTEGRPGLAVRLRVALLDAKGCAPLEGAALDIWHCDALGVYSGFTTSSPDGRGGPGGPPPGVCAGAVPADLLRVGAVVPAAGRGRWTRRASCAARS